MGEVVRSGAEQEGLLFDVGPATKADIPAVEDVRYRVWRSTYPVLAEGYLTVEDVDNVFADPGPALERGERAIDDPNRDIRVARSEGKIIGFSVAGKYGETEGMLKSLYVLDEYQGNGVGRELLRSALEWLEPTKRQISLEVVEGNAPAINLYSAFGFRVTRKFPQDTPDPPLKWIPHLEMIREPGELK